VHKRSSLALLILGAAALLPRGAQAAGEIYWFSLLSEDLDKAAHFYTELLGWEIVPSPTGGLMALRNGQPFAGLNAIEDRLPAASESLWLAAITVDDPARSVAAAKRLGATIHRDVGEVPGFGTYALIQDPQGAPLLLVRPDRPLGGRQGYSGWRWAELWTHDTGAAAGFYREVIGYEIQNVAIGSEIYTAFGTGEQHNAGLIELERKDIAPRWAPYIGVTDLRAVLYRVWEAGGQVLREPAEVSSAPGGANRVALVADPSGAAFFLYQLDERATADPTLVADTPRTAPTPSTRVGDSMPNVHFSVTVGYGFGPGWGSAYPDILRARLGPY